MNTKPNIQLRRSEESDLENFFQFQLDKDAIYMAAFTPENPMDKATYLTKYTKHLNDSTINNQTILMDNAIIGSIAKFEREGDAEITYLIDKNLWGKGIATMALEKFLTFETSRPIFGRVAFDNVGSQKVLEKNGFTKIGTDRFFANARQMEIEEFIYKLI
ncbi:GNAT family N-acetyltransferase [Chryseobacterium herbae]|uniref:GNAT family N-acetyltransferase n=1 Tax=Chryseobacterium herbae TaxID=2976476 RepID=A0ABT2IST8_9FLAO|nr:GNAT family N-acetyltransferase [Chryseobacterium sp. pc1-10]MCT2561889.1 GNAT family N-acetyltransferase [Chryseobacterium sp. pc1-10]